MPSLISPLTYFSLRGLCKRVNLQLQAVNVEEHGVEVLDLLSALGNQIPLEAEELCQLGGHGICHSGVDVHWDLLDPLGCLFSNLLNVYTTIRTGKRENIRLISRQSLTWQQ